ncbi:MAG: CapA family protein [Clostridia bacterium]|nr:CapA family protein [Clostridia bacterium]
MAETRKTTASSAAKRTESSQSARAASSTVRRTAASSQSAVGTKTAVKRQTATRKDPSLEWVPENRKRTSPAPVGKKAPGSRQTAKGSASKAKTGVKSAKPAQKKGGFMDIPVVSRVRELMPKNVNWPLILVIAISVLILVGIITLMSIGISRCAGGCSEGGGAASQATMKPQIHLTQTATPEPAVPGQETDDPAQQTFNQVVPDNGLRSATIRTMGDFVIHEEVFLNAERLAKTTNYQYPYNFAPMLDPVWDVLGNADFTVTNVDGCLGGKEAHKYGYRGYPQFNTPQYILANLKDASVDMVTLANNHMLDGWFDGLMKTIENVEYVGLKHVGASRTQDERNTPVIYEINGIKVGFLNYTEDLNSMDQQSALDKRAMQFAVHAVKNSNSTKDAKALREAGADVIVCFMHWGTEYELEPDRDQKSLAQKLVECGVDVIIGGHPHVVQRAEWLTGTNQFGEKQETLCLYSLGNFLSFQRAQYRDGGIIFDFTIQEQPDGSFRIINAGYIPTWVWVTGTEKSNYNFQVLNIADYINNPPANMTNDDYQKMLQSYNDSIAAMSKGVGNLLAK